MFARATLIWLGFFVLAMLNGTLRELVIKRLIHEPWAHHFSALTAVILFGLYGWMMRKHLMLTSEWNAMFIGFYWLLLTIVTETFVVGRWMGKHSWSEILANYDLIGGNLWPLVLLWIALLPYVIFKFGRS